MFSVIIKPRQKASWGVVTLLALGAFCLAIAAVFAGAVLATMGEGILYVLALLAGALVFGFFGVAMVQSALSALFTTTTVEFDGVFLKVRNRPFGESFTFPAEKLRGVSISEPGRPSLHRILVVTEEQGASRQVCVFGRKGEELMSLYHQLRSLSGEEVPD